MSRKLWLVPVIGLLLLSGCGTLDKDMEHKTASPSTGVTLSGAAQQKLTVTKQDLLPTSAKCHGGSKFNWNSVDGPHYASDSVSTRFKASRPAPVRKEVFAENCTNPTLLDMNLQALSRVTVSGWNVADHNPWMGKFLKKAADPGLRLAYLTKKQDVKGVFVTAEFQRVAAMTNTLLMRFRAAGLVSERSKANWHLPGGGLVAGELVRTKLNKKQEALPVFRFELTEKGRGCVYAIGFNKFDKRFERLSCEKPSTPGTPGKPGTPGTPGTPPGNPPSTPPGTPPGNPPETHKCPPDKPHGTWPICKDGPERDPAAQGKAPTGGGKKDTTGAGTKKPKPTFRPDPLPTQQPKPQPTKTPRPEPTKTPEPDAPEPTAPAQTCHPSPGKSSC